MTLGAGRGGGGTFADVSAIHPDGTGRWRAEVDPGWTVGGKPNGGYLLAMLARAAGEVSGHPDVIAASAHYLRSPDPGPVVVEAELRRGGRTTSQVAARLVQDGAACVDALLTTSGLAAASKPFWEAGLPAAPATPFEACRRLHADPPGGLRVAIMDQVDLRFDPESTGFLSGRPSGRGELWGWLALPDQAPFDPTSLLFAVDAFPPATLDVEVAGWVPTLELTVYVRARPEPGPVRILQRAQLIDGRRVDEACFVWDVSGRLVAQGTQLAGIRLG